MWRLSTHSGAFISVRNIPPCYILKSYIGVALIVHDPHRAAVPAFTQWCDVTDYLATASAMIANRVRKDTYG